MTAATWPAAALCLTTGALLGGLFLLLKLLRVLLRGGWLLTAALDLLFCLVCGVTAFLIALVLDKGRLRFFQAALQLLGAWGTVTALDPFITGLSRQIKRLGRFFARKILSPVLRRLARARAAAGSLVRRAIPKPRRPKRKNRRGKRPQNRRTQKKLPPKRKNREKPLEKLT